MYYICIMRTLIRSKDFDEFYNSLSPNVQSKVKYAMNIIAEVKVVNSKLVKRLVDTDFYELRISVGNEYRVILFTIDHENFIEAEQILLLVITNLSTLKHRHSPFSMSKYGNVPLNALCGFWEVEPVSYFLMTSKALVP